MHKYTHILYHRGCPDGFGAAFAAWLSLGDQATYIPVQYGEDPPALPPDAQVLLVDFSYKRPVLETLRSRVAALTVLDHHKTAQADLMGLPDTHFDMDHSGAVLCWQHFHPEVPRVPALFLYLQDRDLWRWELPHSAEVSAAIMSWPFDFKTWNHLFMRFPDEISPELINEGAAILRAKDQQIEATLKNTFLSEVAGATVPVVNTNMHISETLNELCRKRPEYAFAAAYFDLPTGKRKWSLRSVGDCDVAEISKRHGGGGHMHAAGFESDPEILINKGRLQ